MSGNIVYVAALVGGAAMWYYNRIKKKNLPQHQTDIAYTVFPPLLTLYDPDTRTRISLPYGQWHCGNDYITGFFVPHQKVTPRLSITLQTTTDEGEYHLDLEHQQRRERGGTYYKLYQPFRLVAGQSLQVQQCVHNTTCQYHLWHSPRHAI